MLRTARLVVLLAALPLLAVSPSPVERAEGRITGASAFATMDHLASAQFAGRLSGTEGYARAAVWVAAEAKRAGLLAPADWPGYLQPVDVTLGGIDSSALYLLPPAEGGPAAAPEELTYYKDYMPMLNSGGGDVSAEVVFAGFGIRAPERGRDDYAGLEVKGKVVMVLRGEPEKGDWKGLTSTLSRTKTAAEQGAAAFLLVDSPVLSANDRIDHEMPEAMVGEAVADRLLASQKVTVAELRKILVKGGTASFPTGRSVHFAVRAKPQRAVTAPNVVALLPGADSALKGEYVVVGAHLDHLGEWPQFNAGADDNASGAAALLEMARAAASVGRAPRRTLVFVWFAGEELGLLGAEHFAGHPPAGLTKCTAVLNVDMVGAGTGLWVAGGENFPEIFEALTTSRDRFAPEFQLKAGRIRGEARADHGPFYDRGVHAVSVFGMGGKHNGYHTPEDTAYFVTPKTMESTARTVLGAAWTLADAEK